MSLAEPLQQIDRTFVLHRGRKLSYFGGCDYFRLSSHPEVLRALAAGIDKFGLTVAASRMTTGNHRLFGKLETALARFFGAEGAVLLSNGYATNLAFAQSFVREFTHVFVDERAHGSLLDAVALLGVRAVRFLHRDVVYLQQRLRSLPRSARPLIVTDGLFAHDGSVAPLADYLRALPRSGMLLVDDAHGAGTIGRTGKGSPEVWAVRDGRLVQTVSLSKAFGVYGGAVLGSRSVVKRVQDQSRIFRGNTPLPLPLAYAGLKAIELLGKDRQMRRRLKANTSHVKAALRSAGRILAQNDSPIAAVVPESRAQADRISRSLLRAGVYPCLIRYGDGKGPGSFRFAISSEHTPAQLDALVRGLSE